VPNRKHCWKFKGKDFLDDLKMEFKTVLEVATTLIYERALSNLASINFKDNPVKILKSSGMAGGITKQGVEVTSDAKRKHAVIDALTRERVTSITNDVLTARVRSVNKNFKDSHIGIYYEHGTGTHWDGLETKVPIVSGASSSAKRAGQIVSRSGKVDYGMGRRGVWVDLGGNMRITGSKMAGVHDEGFMNYIGEETKAYHWFSKAFKESKSEIYALYNEAIKRVNPAKSKYWIYMKNFTLGVD
jgi:hypothetical protein